MSGSHSCASVGCRRIEVLRLGESRGPQPPASGGPQLVLHSFAISAGCCPKVYYNMYCDSSSRAVRRRPTAADCNSLFARLRPPPSANSSLQKPIILKKTQITTKKACYLLYDSIIRTTFGTSDPSKCDVNRIAVVVNVENLQPDSIRGCPTSDRQPRSEW